MEFPFKICTREKKEWYTRGVKFYWDADDACAFSMSLKEKFDRIAFIAGGLSIYNMKYYGAKRYVEPPGLYYFSGVADLDKLSEYSFCPGEFNIFDMPEGWRPIWGKGHDLYRNGDLVHSVENVPPHVKYTVGHGCEGIQGNIGLTAMSISYRPEDKEIPSFYQKVLRVARRHQVSVRTYDRDRGEDSGARPEWIGRELYKKMKDDPSILLDNCRRLEEHRYL